MSDYIKREDAIDIVKNLKRFSCFGDDGFVQIPMVYCELMKVAPADVAPVRHGRWTHERLPSTSGGSYAVIRCSECQLQVPTYETRFCPNCGARMDGESDD